MELDPDAQNEKSVDHTPMHMHIRLKYSSLAIQQLYTLYLIILSHILYA